MEGHSLPEQEEVKKKMNLVLKTEQSKKDRGVNGLSGSGAPEQPAQTLGIGLGTGWTVVLLEVFLGNAVERECGHGAI